ncbi:MAG: delta-aminolevulinic acid dehydratase [Gammaproteobacteria bacterium RIFCSPHIGHO2_12_FULL_42_10]|nr:MAG: delta-aminolevulinic acid dehydratase [Gammaproteobacteria bacterium RIFCSPHIGHO2_12_FULL_42_10]
MLSTSYGSFPTTRLRRLRHHAKVRDLVRETVLHADRFVMPIFVKSGAGIKQPIASMPGLHQFSTDRLTEEIESLQQAGINKILLFGIPSEKDALGQVSYSKTGVVQSAMAVIKKISPDMLIIADLCFCEYTDHGHCGVLSHIDREGVARVHNDETLKLLAKQAVCLAEAGVDIVAPSGCMDGMVHTVRGALDQAGFCDLPILSYAMKYASSFYGPFREAAEGAPKAGDRATYQSDCANAREALRECALDVLEGADMLMVKPAHTYLDVIYRVKQAYPALPLAAYHVSGEYAMIKAAAANGWLDEKRAVLEVLTAIHRAGADFIITYYAKDVAGWL